MKIQVKDIPTKQWIGFGVFLFIVLFLWWCDYERQRPIREASEGLQGILDKDKQLNCDFLRTRGDWQVYDKNGCDK